MTINYKYKKEKEPALGVRGAFRSVPTQGSLSPVSEDLDVCPLWGAAKGNSNIAYNILGISWIIPTNNSKEAFSHLVLGVC